MSLWCSVCHTEWKESAWQIADKCPFKDCAGHLSSVPPQTPAKPKAKKERPTYPLLENSK